MCGLVGVITEEGNLNLKERQKFMRQALIIDTLRGEDSTGLFVVPHDNVVTDKMSKYDTAYWIKQLGDGYGFVNSKDYEETMELASLYKYMVGHNRAATQGSVVVDNAHPFQEGAITMVHNGTLRCDLSMPKTMDELGVSVDSHAICHNLALQPNTEEGVQAVVKTLNGAFTLIWHDARDDTLNIVRNEERPLFFMQSKYNKTLYFASEAEMLALLAKRLKMAVHEDVHFPNPGSYMKFKGDDIFNPEVYELDLHVEDYYGWGNTTTYWEKYAEIEKPEDAAKTALMDALDERDGPTDDTPTDPVVYNGDGDAVYPGPGNTLLSASGWLGTTINGCSVCGDLPHLDEAWDCEWEGNNMVCGSCMETYNGSKNKAGMQ